MKTFGEKEDFNKIYKNQDFADASLLANGHRNERRRFLDCLIKYVQNDNIRAHQCKILEVGCGFGIDALITSECTDCSAYGIDLSYEALRIAKGSNKLFSKQLFSVNADGLHLPFSDESFDMVFSQGVLEHIADENIFLKEQSRVLKSGGKLVINVPQKYTAYTLMKHHLIKTGKWPWGYEREYNYWGLKQLGRNLEMKEIEVFGCRYWLHPLEPAWVLRSFYNKLQKLNPWRHRKVFCLIGNYYNRLWDRMENLFGYIFMREIVIVFEKP